MHECHIVCRLDYVKLHYVRVVLHIETQYALTGNEHVFSTLFLVHSSEILKN